MNPVLLDVQNLQTVFRLRQRTVYAVNGISFQLRQGEVLGIVGESGSGKSVSALSIMRLIETPGEIIAGKVLFHSGDKVQDLLTMSQRELETIRGNEIAMVFQDPMTSLNPVLSIGYQLMEPLMVHKGLSKAEAEKEALSLLEKVGIPEPEVRMRDFPHQFSGGMRQRVMVAMAAACTPRLFIADEPTTALDVTIQAQILDLLNQLKNETGTTVIIITHDLGVVAEIASHVAVMYAGRIVEYGPVNEIFNQSTHPYTQALMGSIPKLRDWPHRLATIEGSPPSLTEPIVGCAYAPRCPLRMPICDQVIPELVTVNANHTCACWATAPGPIPEGANV